MRRLRMLAIDFIGVVSLNKKLSPIHALVIVVSEGWTSRT